METFEELPEIPKLRESGREEVKMHLIKLNDNVSDALGELQYAEENDLNTEAVVEQLEWAEKRLENIKDFYYSLVLTEEEQEKRELVL